MAWETIETVPSAFNADVAPSALDANTVSSISNIDFYSGNARALGDLNNVAVWAVTPYALQSYYDDATAYVGVCTDLSVFALKADGLLQDILPTTGLTGSTYWDTTVFGKWFVCTNDIVGQAPHAISVGLTATSGKLAPIPGWPATWECTIIKTHRNMLWAANTIEATVAYPNRVRWSSSAPTDALPSTWVPAPGNDAGSNDLEISSSQIIDLCPLGDVMYIGGAGGIWAARWVGGSYVYNFSQLNGIQGPRALKCMESIGDAVAVLTLNDVLLITETSSVSLANDVVSSIIRQIKDAQLMWIAPTEQLVVAYSVLGETGLQHGLIWDKQTGSWGLRNFPSTPLNCVAPIINPIQAAPITWGNLGSITWETLTGTWGDSSTIRNVIYSGANSSGIYTNTNTTYNWVLERISEPAPNGEDIRIRSLEAEIDGRLGSTIKMRIGSSQNAGASVLWGPLKSYTLDNNPLRHDDAQQGRYFSYHIEGNGSARITKLRFYYKVKKNRP